MVHLVLQLHLRLVRMTARGARRVEGSIAGLHRSQNATQWFLQIMGEKMGEKYPRWMPLLDTKAAGPTANRLNSTFQFSQFGKVSIGT